MGAKTFVIGDIHGGLKALKELITKLPLDKKDRLIFLGDYVDGWSESSGVIQYLIGLNYVYDCIFIKGNHDEWCETWLHTGSINSDWEFHGGRSTIKSYSNYPDEGKATHLEFFNRLKDYFVDENNKLYIHAGFTSMHGPAKEFHTSNYSWDRTLWEMVLSLDKDLSVESPLYPKRLKHFEEIYIGHTPVTDFGFTQPANLANLWNVDTGAAFMGPLSAIETTSKEIYQSTIVQELYPDEKGRNK